MNPNIAVGIVFVLCSFLYLAKLCASIYEGNKLSALFYGGLLCAMAPVSVLFFLNMAAYGFYFAFFVTLPVLFLRLLYILGQLLPKKCR